MRKFVNNFLRSLVENKGWKIIWKQGWRCCFAAESNLGEKWEKERWMMDEKMGYNGDIDIHQGKAGSFNSSAGCR